MKRFLILAILLYSGLFMSHAQNVMELYADDLSPESVFELNLCYDEYQQVILHAREGADPDYRCWIINGFEHFQDEIILNPDPDLINYYLEYGYDVTYREYLGDDGWFHLYFNIMFRSNFVPNSFNRIIWKHLGEFKTVEAVGIDSIEWPFEYSFQWSTGETTRAIEVVEPYNYTCEIIDYCGTATRTFSVRDNVEIYRATVDLETNLNKTTWQVTPEQAEYISEVKVYRDGLLVGAAPYEQGYYLDAIGSDNAARNYRIVGVSVEGEDCPIESYEKGTIHTTYYQDVNGNLNMTWNIPYVEEGAQGSLTYFQICKYDPNTGEITVVDQVNAAITDYTCGVNQFDGGQAVIAAVFNDGKGFEELSFSNLTTDILGLEEDGPSTGSRTLTVYPNPAKDRVTIEGTGTMTVTNALGQTILTKEINGKETVELPQGMYFVKLGSATRKVVVE